MENNRLKLGLMDYGVGNLASLKGSLEKLGYKCSVIKDQGNTNELSAIFLPGVGSFSFAMKNLKKNGGEAFIKEIFHQRKIPIIGICLGMQLLFDFSEEGECEGLGLLPGTVEKLPDGACHVGWNLVKAVNCGAKSLDTAFYFNHSYRVRCSDNLVVGESEYLGRFPVAVQHERFFGFQFHPEKSQRMGSRLIRECLRDA